jgi:hypothetical protein
VVKKSQPQRHREHRGETVVGYDSTPTEAACANSSQPAGELSLAVFAGNIQSKLNYIGPSTTGDFHVSYQIFSGSTSW